jgi:hypothetical protein
MNAKKFLIVVLLFGLLKICHAAPALGPSISFQMPQAQSNSVNLYPCLSCPAIAHTNTNCMSQNLQEGVGLHVVF